MVYFSDIIRLMANASTRLFLHRSAFYFLPIEFKSLRPGTSLSFPPRLHHLKLDPLRGDLVFTFCQTIGNDDLQNIVAFGQLRSKAQRGPEMKAGRRCLATDIEGFRRTVQR